VFRYLTPYGSWQEFGRKLWSAWSCGLVVCTTFKIIVVCDLWCYPGLVVCQDYFCLCFVTLSSKERLFFVLGPCLYIFSFHGNLAHTLCIYVDRFCDDYSISFLFMSHDILCRCIVLFSWITVMFTFNRCSWDIKRRICWDQVSQDKTIMIW
jgi:hypothetical protein